MARRTVEMQKFIRYYKDQTGEKEVDMRKVAALAEKMGWKMPTPVSPHDLLAKQFSEAAREETRKDPKTRRPYRANHALSERQGDMFYTVWIDIDEAPRKKILKSLINRREQMVGDGLQLTLDADHWNNVNPNEEPIRIPMDFTEDVEWRKNAPDEDEEKAA